jgi:hypothetical protein
VSVRPSRSQIAAIHVNWWPGIYDRDGWCSCTWATFEGKYQVKIRDEACVTHVRYGIVRPLHLQPILRSQPSVLSPSSLTGPCFLSEGVS